MDGQKFLTEFLEAGRATVAQDTMKDGFATLVDSEGQPYVANLNPKEKERYEETKKPLSKVKKEKGEEGKKEPEAKKTEEKKTEEKSEKKGAEVIELHPEKAKEKIEDNEKKYEVLLGGQKAKKTKAEIKKLIDVFDKKLDENLDLLIKYKEDGIKVRQKIDNAKDVYHFWKHYRDVEANKGKTPSEYYKSSKSLWNITDKEDLDLIKNNNKDLNLMVTRGKSHLDRALNEAKYLPQTEESVRGIIRKLKDQVKSLKETLAQDSLDTFLKNISVEQR